MDVYRKCTARRDYIENFLTTVATDSSLPRVTVNSDMKSQLKGKSVDYAVNWKHYAVN